MHRGALVGIVLLAGCGFQTAAGNIGDGAVGDDGAIRDATVAIDVAPAPSTCDGAWCLRKAITIHAAQVTGGPLADFPVLIELASDADLHAGARSDGADILFTGADGATKLSYERASYVAATGKLIAWVRIPSLSSTTDGLIYMYWGNPAAADQQDAAHTWSSAYQAVWHLDDSTHTIADSTANANTGSGSPPLVLGAAGQIGAAATFDGAMANIAVPASAGLTSTNAAGTFGLWVNFVKPANGHFQSLLSSTTSFASTTPDGYSWAQQANGDHYFYPWVGNTSDYNLGSDPFAVAGWHYAVVTLEYATKAVKIYVDGVAIAFNVVNVPTLWTQKAIPTGWFWGGNPAPGAAGESFAGMLDEIRVANVVRSAGWIATEYRNQHAPSTFYALGAPEILMP